jgi:hypothetical protein
MTPEVQGKNRRQLRRRDETFANRPVALVELPQSAKFLPSLKECIERRFSYGLNLYLLPIKGVKPTEHPTNPGPLLRSGLHPKAALCRREKLFTERPALLSQILLV